MKNKFSRYIKSLRLMRWESLSERHKNYVRAMCKKIYNKRV